MRLSSNMIVLENENEKIIYDFNRIHKAMDSQSDLYTLQQAGLDIDRESIKSTIAEHLEIVNPENGVSYSLNDLTWDEMVAQYGAKPAGAEPRTRDEAVPERAGDEQRVSDFLRSFVESDKATDEMVAQVRAAVENGDNRKPYANILTEKYREKRRVQSLHQTAWMCSSINWI